MTAIKQKNNKSTGTWSAKVTAESHALDLEPGVFSFQDPLKVAKSLKASADKSQHRKGTPFQSAMSMLNFYINRAGKKLSHEKLEILQEAKKRLREIYNK